MTLYKDHRSPFWYFEFVVHGHRYRGTTAETNKTKAREVESRRRKEIMDQAVHGKLPRMTLGQAIDDYLALTLIPKNPKPDTINNHINRLALLRARFGAEIYLDELSTSMVTEWVKDMRRQPRERKPAWKGLKGVRRNKTRAPNGAGLEATTINRRLQDLRAILNKARNDWGVAVASVKIKLLPEAPESKRIKWLEPAEERRLLDCCNDHVRDIVMLMIDTGLRRSNAVELTWDQVKIEREDVRLVIQAGRVKNKEAIGRKVPKRSADMLRRLYHARSQQGPRVFLYRGKPIKNFRTGFEAACVRAGLDDWTIHDLRHAFASKVVQRGGGLVATSKLLGHRSTRMSERYIHLAPSDLDGVVDLLNERT